MKRWESNSNFSRSYATNLKSVRPSVAKWNLGIPSIVNLEVIRNPVKTLNYLDCNTIEPMKMVV